MAKNEIIKAIMDMSGSKAQYTIFRDWVESMALAIQNSCTVIHNQLWQDRENRYLEIVNQYPDNGERFSEMMAWLVEMFEEEITDALGEIYMESGCGNKYTGQFFTPFHVSKMCAQLALIDSEDGIYRLNEPSSGGGGMILASAIALRDRGVNYQKQMKVVAQDLDWIGVYMTYVQLSICGIDAVVVQGDTLCDPFTGHNFPPNRVFRTPRNMGALL